MKLRNSLIAAATSLLFVTVTSADPVPYPDVGSGGSTKVDGKSVNIKGSGSSTTDSGSTKGVVSSKNTGKTTFASSSSDVKVEGKNVIRLNTPSQ